MISELNRHIFRPAHLHIRIHAPGYEGLTTALYFKGDPYLTSDAVFGVKSSLIMVRFLPASTDFRYITGALVGT
jgi:protocatechuate 3,4-dioxygenase beta subunit